MDSKLSGRYRRHCGLGFSEVVITVFSLNEKIINLQFDKIFSYLKYFYMPYWVFGDKKKRFFERFVKTCLIPAYVNSA